MGCRASIRARERDYPPRDLLARAFRFPACLAVTFSSRTLKLCSNKKCKFYFVGYFCVSNHLKRNVKFVWTNLLVRPFSSRRKILSFHFEFSDVSNRLWIMCIFFGFSFFVDFEMEYFEYLYRLYWLR